MRTEEIDRYVRTAEFAGFVASADAFAAKNNLDQWATRVAWVGISQGVRVVRRWIQRSRDYKNGHPWACYRRLVDEGVFLEESDVAQYIRAQDIPMSDEDVRDFRANRCIFYEPAPRWEDGDGPLLWVRTMAEIANGTEPPADFPRWVAVRETALIGNEPALA